ncbi:hypothetical protein BANRA_00005 [Acinetobacter baumannii]|nr:hypothetical protein BANRA_00005 [Acinetobacter baumannii]
MFQMVQEELMQCTWSHLTKSGKHGPMWQHQQAKVEELQKQLSEYIFVSETLDEMYVKEVQKSDELQKAGGCGTKTNRIME